MLRVVEKTLSFQVAQLGAEKEVLGYIPEEYRHDNPFVGQNYLVHELEKELTTERSVPVLQLFSGQIKGVLNRCRLCIAHIRDNHTQRGASLHQTYMLLLLLFGQSDGTHVHPWSICWTGITGSIPANSWSYSGCWSATRTGKTVSLNSCLNPSVIWLAPDCGSIKKTRRVISISRPPGPEYQRTMVGSAMGGGAWVCLVVLIKNLLIRLPMAIFWHGFAYSINYSLGFILIEETHTTLATKQPAFTASAVASSLDTRKNTHQPNLYNLAITVAKVSRSQIASFAGNLIVVFPGAWLLAWGYEKLMGAKLVAGDAAAKMLRDQHPWHSLSLLYACNTGVFLFLSGIIAGYVQNKIQYSQISRRLQTHPVLRLSIPKEKLRRVADYVEQHAGTLIGNICLGFFLGMAGFVGEIFGIRFDIRHITISAGNVSLAVYGLGFGNVPIGYLATVLAGVLGIGFLNFLVSFSLAFIVAARSRGVRIREYPGFLGILWRYFRSNPLDFIRPRRRPEAGEQRLDESE